MTNGARGSACSSVREVLSARLDAEDEPLPAAVIDRHLAHCADCANYEAAVQRLHRSVRVGDADAVPDLTSSVTAAVAQQYRHSPTARSRRLRQLRGLVGAAGVTQLLLAVPLLVSATGMGTHAGRDLAGVQAALGAGFILAAIQPWRTAGVLPVAAIVAGFAVVAGTVDVVAGTASLVSELRHVAEIAGVVALAALWRRWPSRTSPRPVLAR